MLRVPVLVQEAFRKDETEKKYRIELADGSDVIENDRLVEESVTFTERMCSGSELKFGLCEANGIEFQCFDTPDIKGKGIVVYISVEYKDADGVMKWYDIPLGQFDVNACPIEQSSGIRKVTAYNKIRSEYLDADLTDKLAGITEPGSDKISVYRIKKELLKEYEITERRETAQSVSPTNNMSSTNEYEFGVTLGSLPLPNGFNNSNYGTASLHAVFREKIIVIDGLSDTEYYNIKMPLELQTERYKVFDELLEETDAEFDSASMDEYVQNVLQSYSANVEIDFVDGSSRNYTIEKLNTEDLLTNISQIRVNLLVHAAIKTTIAGTIEVWGNYTSDSGNAVTSTFAKDADFEKIEIQRLALNEVEKIRLNKESQGLTLRKVISANYELLAQYGKLDRESNLIQGTELNAGGLYPSETLYPSTTLFPSGADASMVVTMYERLWTERDKQQKFRNLIVNYKGTVTDAEGKTTEQSMQYETQVNADGNADYTVENNWILENVVMTEEKISQIAAVFAEKIRDIVFTPFELQQVGIPYLEAGDAIEIQTETDTIKSYVLQRTMTGIKALTDVLINGEVDIF